MEDSTCSGDAKFLGLDGTSPRRGQLVFVDWGEVGTKRGAAITSVGTSFPLMTWGRFIVESEQAQRVLMKRKMKYFGMIIFPYASVFRDQIYAKKASPPFCLIDLRVFLESLAELFCRAV